MIKIVPQGDEGDQDGCMIEWSFTINKMEGWVLDDLVRKYEVGLQRMAKRMEIPIWTQPKSQISYKIQKKKEK